MTRREKAERILSTLEALYPKTPIPLDHSDPFTLLVAVMLSAQTTDKKVNEVTPALFQRASTPQAMSRMAPEEIKQYIRQIGLSGSKAGNLHKLSHQLIENFGGEVPRSIEEMETLAGVGHKTASVVAAQAFGIPAFPVDTHIHRLAHRWRLSNGKNVVQTEKDLKTAFPMESWNKVHLQIIYFGREHCPALYHDLSACPICSWASPKSQWLAEQRRNAELKRARRTSKLSQ
ncbi:MAG: endonuclease III [Vulcanimicrobiota bacterium]